MPIPRIWAVTELRHLRGRDPIAWLAGLAEAGVEAVLLREKTLSDRDLFELGLAARRALPPPARLILHRRFDLALAVGADGVQLSADGLPVELVRRAVPREFLIGRSTHALGEIAAARAAGADSVFFGPILPTPSKSDPGRFHGISSLVDASALGVPVIAIGGMDETSAPAAIAAGAYGVAAIRAFVDPDESARFVAAVRAALARRERSA